MIRALRRQSGWRPFAFITTLWIAIALRAFASAEPADAPDKYAPICADGTLVYINIATGEIFEPSEVESAEASEVCPWFGTGHDAPAAESFALAGVKKLATDISSTPLTSAAPKIPSPFRARAPPHLI